MQYEVVVAVRPRPQPSMQSASSDPNVPVGTKFDSSTTQVDSATQGSPVMVKIESGPYAGKWVPEVYLGVEYVRQTGSTPPPDTSLPASILSTAVLKDANGNVLATYEGELTKK